MLECAMHADLLVNRLELRLGGLGRDRNDLARGNTALLQVDRLVYSEKVDRE